MASDLRLLTIQNNSEFYFNLKASQDLKLANIQQCASSNRIFFTLCVMFAFQWMFAARPDFMFLYDACQMSLHVSGHIQLKELAFTIFCMFTVCCKQYTIINAILYLVLWMHSNTKLDVFYDHLISIILYQADYWIKF